MNRQKDMKAVWAKEVYTIRLAEKAGAESYYLQGTSKKSDADESAKSIPSYWREPLTILMPTNPWNLFRHIGGNLSPF